MRVLDGCDIYEAGRWLGPLSLTEGQRSERMVLVERFGADFVDFHEVDVDGDAQKVYEGRLCERTGAARAPRILMALEGRFQLKDTRNKNGRIYPGKLWERILERGSYVLSRIERGEMLGHVDHPLDGETRLERVSSMVTDLSERGNEILGRIVVFDTTAGRNLKAIYDGGGRFGVSSRGQGSVVRLEGSDVVQEDFVLETWDIVHNPSTPGAYPDVEVVEQTAVTESAAVETAPDAEAPVGRVEEHGRAGAVNEKVGGKTVERTETRPKETFQRATTADGVKAVLEHVEGLTERSMACPEARIVHEARRAYREAAQVRGPLHREELDGVALYVRSIREARQNAPDDKVRIVVQLPEGVSPQTLVEQHGASHRDGACTLTVPMSGVEAVVEAVRAENPASVVVRVDETARSRKAAAEALQPVLEAQVERTGAAVAEAAQHRAALTEVSARIAATRQIIDELVRRVRQRDEQIAELTAELEQHRTDLQEQKASAAAAAKLIEAVSAEVPVEQLRSAVEAIASTHRHVRGLPEAIAHARTVTEAIEIANACVEASVPAIDRDMPERVEEALGRSRRVEETRAREAAREAQALTGSSLKSANAIIETTSKLTATMAQRVPGSR